MKKRTVILRVVQVYLLVWLVSAMFLYPDRTATVLDAANIQKNEHPARVLRSICIAPAIFIVDWQEGEGAFVASGGQSLFFCTPWQSSLLMTISLWIS
jgi:hypothetical protein